MVLLLHFKLSPVDSLRLVDVVLFTHGMIEVLSPGTCPLNSNIMRVSENIISLYDDILLKFYPPLSIHKHPSANITTPSIFICSIYLFPLHTTLLKQHTTPEGKINPTLEKSKMERTAVSGGMHLTPVPLVGGGGLDFTIWNFKQCWINYAPHVWNPGYHETSTLW